MTGPTSDPIVTADVVASRYAGTIRIDDLGTFQIRKLDGMGYELLEQADALRAGGNDPAALKIMYRIAARSIVGLTAEQVVGTDSEPGLGADIIGSIVGLASATIRRVKETTAPKDGAGTTPTDSISPPNDPSPSSSPGSPPEQVAVSPG